MTRFSCPDIHSNYLVSTKLTLFALGSYWNLYAQDVHVHVPFSEVTWGNILWKRKLYFRLGLVEPRVTICWLIGPRIFLQLASKLSNQVPMASVILAPGVSVVTVEVVGTEAASTGVAMIGVVTGEGRAVEVVASGAKGLADLANNRWVWSQATQLKNTRHNCDALA